MAVLLSSRTIFSRPERSQPERTRREDRHSKFYEISDNVLRQGGMSGHDQRPAQARRSLPGEMSSPLLVGGVLTTRLCPAARTT